MCSVIIPTCWFGSLYVILASKLLGNLANLPTYFVCMTYISCAFACKFLSQGVPGLELKSCDIFPKTWSKYAFCQTATSTESFLSRKCLTGDFLSLEIFFWFPLLIALSGQFCLNDQYKRRDASYF